MILRMRGMGDDDRATSTGPAWVPTYGPDTTKAKAPPRSRRVELADDPHRGHGPGSRWRGRAGHHGQLEEDPSLMLLMGMGDAPPAPGRNAAGDEARRKAGLVGRHAHAGRGPRRCGLVDLGAQAARRGRGRPSCSWAEFLFWRSRR